MGVKVQLADGREVNGKQVNAGDVVEVDEGTARVLTAQNIATRVSDRKKAAVVAVDDKADPAGKKG